MSEVFETTLKVDKRIVPLLSKSTYQRSFPYAIRELVSNSYDADATSVKISVNLDKNELIVEDNGNGMTTEEFSFYLTIAGQKRGKRETPKYGRKRIGQFGVGFLAIFPFCESLEIVSTVENSDIIFRATIPTKKFFAESKDMETVEEIPVKGIIEHDSNLKAEHFTRIRLVHPTELVEKYFSIPRKESGNRKSLSIRYWEPITKFKWELQEELPIEFHPDVQQSNLNLFEKSMPLEVYLNNDKLYRNLPAPTIIDGGVNEIAGIHFKYFLSTNYSAIKPEEARWVKVRLNNVGVGERQDFGLKKSRGFTHLHWLSGEVNIIEGLDETITLSRDGFIWSRQYQEFQDKFSEILAKQAYYIDHIQNSEKEINGQLSGSRQKTVASKRDVIEKEIKKLEERGFKIIRSLVEHTQKKGPVQIDKKKKIVHYSYDSQELEDKVSIAGEVKNIVFKEWDPKHSEYPACKINKDGIIEINKKYPLFSTKRYGDIFEKIHIILVLAKKECKSIDEMFSFLIKNIDKEFEDFS